MQGKIIVIDWSIFVFRSIFSWRNNKMLPPEYNCLNMIISCLRHIGIEPYDTIIIACDGQGNWRKDLEKDYKANRKAFRESFEDIDWNDMFERFDCLLNKVNLGTDWHIIKLDKIEADDIASVSCRYFTDNDIVLVSYDSDWQMLWNYSNVKIFSPLLKPKRYKIPPKNFNAYQFLSKKIQKEATDNLINPVLSEMDYEKRMTCVNLLELPEFVENRILEEFKKLQPKEADSEYIPFEKLRTKINGLYNDRSQIITYEKSIQKEERKARKKRRKTK